jgi:hypothetical protein
MPITAACNHAHDDKRSEEVVASAWMADESILPVWLCVSKEGDDLQLLCAMLQHHGIEARVAPIPSHIGRHVADAEWVRESDYDQARLLIAQM